MLPLILTSGDPSGIGPELIVKAYLARQLHAISAFCALIDPLLLKKRMHAMGVSIPLLCLDSVEEAAQAFEKGLPVLSLAAKQEDRIGVPLIENAKAIIESIETGAQLVLEKRAAALVTAPICKKNLYDFGFSFPGHTEFLAAIASRTTAQPARSIMMLAGKDLKTVPITIHCPLIDVTKYLTQQKIVETGQIVYRELENKFGIARPRLAFCGLNPHAGESGTMGSEEEEIIIPAIKVLHKQGIAALGPFPSDTIFHQKARQSYDAVLCMYHDQALIPIKTLYFDTAVNITLGLPFIRTSPDHGTAFDIAPFYRSSPKSFISAIKVAQKMAIAAKA